MNGYNNTATVEDSISRFITLGKDGLEALAADMGLKANHADLVFCQNYFRAREKRQPTFEELCLIDGIIKGRHSQLSHSAITEVKVNDEYIRHAYLDLTAKWAAIRNDSAPLSLHSASKIAARVLASKGRLPSGGMCSGEVGNTTTPLKLTDSDGTVLCYRKLSAAQATVKRLELNTAIMLLSSDSLSAANYKRAVEALMLDTRVSGNIVSHTKISGIGLVATLAEMTSQGIFADITRLSSSPTVGMLSGSFVGLSLLTALRDNTEHIASVAAEHGLRATYFAKVTSSGRFALAKDTCPPVNLELGFITRLIDGLDNTAFTVHGEDFGAICDHSEVYINDLSAPINAPISMNSVTVSPILARMSENCYSSALNATLDALLGLIACGIPASEATLSFKYTLPTDKSSDTDNGKALAMILGTYHAMSELGIPDIDSRIVYGKGYSVCAVAFSRSAIMAKSNHFMKAGNPIYYLGFARNSDLTPRLDSVAQLWGYVTALYSAGKIVSARPTFGSLTNTLTEMSTDTLRANITSPLNFYTQGIIIECSKELDIEKIGVVGE